MLCNENREAYKLRTSRRKSKKEKVSALLDLADLPGNTIKAGLPPALQPQLATLVDGPPNDPAEWTYEIKFDGYRLLTRIEGEKIQLFTRNGNDWSHKLPHLVKAVGEMELPSGWLDGEVIVPNENGIPDFRPCKTPSIVRARRSIIYYVFDIPFHAGYDLRTPSG